MATDILFPPGRMVGGDLDKLSPRTGDNGQPKLGKDGQPEQQCNIGYAIPKGPEAHMQIAPGQPPAWAHTEWGQKIYQEGVTAHPNLVLTPTFAWKVIDGDSPIPNKKGKRPCDQTGYPGHWVLWFSQGWLPKRVNRDGTVELPEGAILPGYFIQMYGNVAGNKLVPNGTPGVYLNPIAVALVGEGDRIVSVSVDTTAVGFGAAPLPAGARPVTAAAPQFAAPPVYQPPAAAPPVYQPPAAPAPGPGPAPDFLTPPPAPMAPPPAPPVPAGPQMTALATATYQQYIAAGWTDEQLRASGLMV